MGAETTDLYSPTDVRKVREILLKEQEGKCAISGQEFPPKDFHLDHAHDSEQLVRGALYKQSNMALGKLENLWIRYLSYWYDGTLQDFLRQSADYLDLPQSKKWRHPGWIKKVKTRFNKLNATQMNTVLKLLGAEEKGNQADRKKLFSKLVMDRKLGYNRISSAINKAIGEDSCK